MIDINAVTFVITSRSLSFCGIGSTVADASASMSYLLVSAAIDNFTPVLDEFSASFFWLRI